MQSSLRPDATTRRSLGATLAHTIGTTSSAHANKLTNIIVSTTQAKTWQSRVMWLLLRKQLGRPLHELILVAIALSIPTKIGSAGACATWRRS